MRTLKNALRSQIIAYRTLGHHSFKYLGPKILGLTPNEWKNINSITAFKNKLKQFEFENCPCKLCKEYVQGVGNLR